MIGDRQSIIRQYLPREGDGVLELVRGIAEPSRQRNHPSQPLPVGCAALPRPRPGAHALIPTTPLLGEGAPPARWRPLVLSAVRSQRMERAVDPSRGLWRRRRRRNGTMEAAAAASRRAGGGRPGIFPSAQSVCTAAHRKSRRASLT